MKDYIEITDKNNNKRKVEIVAIFQLEGYEYNYIIYRELDKSHDYIAKYTGEDLANLNTELSEKELELAETIYRSVKDESRN